MSQKTVSYSKIVALIRKQINELRINPISYLGYLNSKKIRFDKKDPNRFYPLKKLKQLSLNTKQGQKVIDETISYIMNQTISVKLIWSYQLHLIAHRKAQRLFKISQFNNFQQVDNWQNIEKIFNVTSNINNSDLKKTKLNRSSSNSFNNRYSLNSLQQSIGQLSQDQFNSSNSILSSNLHNKTKKQNRFIIKEQKINNQGVACILDQEYYLIYYGVIDPKQLVSCLLIDDGFPNREHRRALFNKKMNYIGIGIHQHPSKSFIVVIVLANHVKSMINQTNQQIKQNCQCKII